MKHQCLLTRIWVEGIVVASFSSLVLSSGIEFTGRFAPHQGIVTPYEKPLRQELCLNGKWQFQPISLPEGYEWDRGNVPFLEKPDPEKWEVNTIKIPSAWNVNNWGLWGKAGIYDPVPLYYPSYPESWKHHTMGWLRKIFKVPNEWNSQRLILRFEAVAGESRILVNGKTVIESHYGSYTPFETDITEYINPSGDNELLVGIRSLRLFQKEHPVHKWGWRAMGSTGSDMYNLCGIYQDVYLLGLPAVYVDDVFIKPWVDRDEIEVDVTVHNMTSEAEIIKAGGSIRPWKNLTGKDVLAAPEARWMLEDQVMPLSPKEIEILPGESKRITLLETVGGRLNTWSPKQPALYGIVIDIKKDHVVIDHKYVRFGWRQFKINGGDLLLNGQQIRLYGDIMHPFSSFIMTRRTAWAWYSMIKDFGGNAVRPHAQPWPKFYIDMAEEMGIVVLDETGLFGSAGGFNMDEERAWKNCQHEYESLIRRDRNSPAVMGWSFANEMFALGELNNIPDIEYERYRDRLAVFGRIAYQLDPTREWISCDGDKDLNGRLGVWSRHWGDGWKDHQNTHCKLPDDDSKPWMLGEYSGSYYGLPHRLDYLNGDRAYESYSGRVEALGIDIYELAIGIARDKLDYFSASETVWFGLEHLNFGYDDFTRLPTAQDGVFFTRPYQEGEPGMQPERLPPFTATLNPGWDLRLPLYKPLAMFEAMKAALAPGKPLAFSGRVPFLRRPDVPTPTIHHIRFAGSADSDLYKFLIKQNVPVVEAASDFLIIDAHTAFKQEGLAGIVESVLSRNGTVLVMLSGPTVDLDELNRILPMPIELTERRASSFIHGTEHAWMAPFSLRELSFIENENKPYVMQCGLDGPMVREGKVLLEASNIDWTLFNAPENRKCGALTLHEKLQKPSGAALVEWKKGKGRWLLCSLSTVQESHSLNAFWKKLFACLGIDTAGLTKPENEKATPTRSYDLLRDGPIQSL